MSIWQDPDYFPQGTSRGGTVGWLGSSIGSGVKMNRMRRDAELAYIEWNIVQNREVFGKFKDLESVYRRGVQKSISSLSRMYESNRPLDYIRQTYTELGLKIHKGSSDMPFGQFARIVFSKKNEAFKIELNPYLHSIYSKIRKGNLHAPQAEMYIARTLLHELGHAILGGNKRHVEFTSGLSQSELIKIQRIHEQLAEHDLNLLSSYFTSPEQMNRSSQANWLSRQFAKVERYTWGAVGTEYNKYHMGEQEVLAKSFEVYMQKGEDYFRRHFPRTHKVLTDRIKEGTEHFVKAQLTGKLDKKHYSLLNALSSIENSSDYEQAANHIRKSTGKEGKKAFGSQLFYNMYGLRVEEIASTINTRLKSVTEAFDRKNIKFDKHIKQAYRRILKASQHHSTAMHALYELESTAQDLNDLSYERVFKKLKEKLEPHMGRWDGTLSVAKYDPKFAKIAKKGYLGAKMTIDQTIEEVIDIYNTIDNEIVTDEYFQEFRKIKRKYQKEMSGHNFKSPLNKLKYEKVINRLLSKFGDAITVKTLLEQVSHFGDSNIASEQARLLLKELGVDLNNEELSAYVDDLARKADLAAAKSSTLLKSMAGKMILKDRGSAFYGSILQGIHPQFNIHYLKSHYFELVTELMQQGYSESFANETIQRWGLNPLPNNQMEAVLKSTVSKNKKGWFAAFTSRLVFGDPNRVKSSFRTNVNDAIRGFVGEGRGVFGMFKLIAKGKGNWFDKILSICRVMYGRISANPFSVSRQMMEKDPDFNIAEAEAPGKVTKKLHQRRIALGRRLQRWAAGKGALAKPIGGAGKVIERFGFSAPAIMNVLAYSFGHLPMAKTYKSYIGGLITETASWALSSAAATMTYNKVGPYGLAQILGSSREINTQEKIEGRHFSKRTKVSRKSGSIRGFGKGIAGMLASMLVYGLIDNSIRTVGYSIFGEKMQEENMLPGITIGDPSDLFKDHVIIGGSTFSNIEPSGMNLSMFGSGYDASRDPNLVIDVDARPTYKPVHFNRTVGLPQKLWNNRKGAQQLDRNYSTPAPVCRQRRDRVAV